MQGVLASNRGITIVVRQLKLMNIGVARACRVLAEGLTVICSVIERGEMQDRLVNKSVCGLNESPNWDLFSFRALSCIEFQTHQRIVE